MSQDSGFGKLWSADPRTPKIIYIFIRSETKISLYTEPPPFKVDKWVGDFGEAWRIRRIKRGFLFSTFILNLNDVGEIQYKTDNQFGDMLTRLTAH